MSGFLGQILASLGGGEHQQSGEAVHGALKDVLGLEQPSGIAGLIGQFAGNGFAEHAQSWISAGHNLPITAEQVQQVLSNQQVAALVARTGIPVDALMPLVAKILPHAVDHATPEGTVPDSGAPAS